MEKKYQVLRIIIKFQIAIGSICLIIGCFYYSSIIQKNRIPGFGIENYPLEIFGIIIIIISGSFWIAIWLLFQVIIDIEENTRSFSLNQDQLLKSNTVSSTSTKASTKGDLTDDKNNYDGVRLSISKEAKGDLKIEPFLR